MGELKPTTKIQIMGYDLVNVSKAPLEKVYYEHTEFGPAETQSLNDTETQFDFQDDKAQHIVLSSKTEAYKLIGTHNWYNKTLKFTVDTYDSWSLENMDAKQIGERKLDTTGSTLKYVSGYDLDNDGYADVTIEQHINPKSLTIAPEDMKDLEGKLRSQTNKTDRANSELQAEKNKTAQLQSSQTKLEQELTALKEKNKQAEAKQSELNRQITQDKTLSDLTKAVDKLTNKIDTQNTTKFGVHNNQNSNATEKQAKIAFLAGEVGALEERIKQLRNEKERLTGKKDPEKQMNTKQTKAGKEPTSADDIIQQLQAQLIELQQEEKLLETEVNQLKSQSGMHGLFKNFLNDAGQYFQRSPHKPQTLPTKEGPRRLFPGSGEFKLETLPTTKAPQRLFPGSGEFKPQIEPEKTLPTGGKLDGQ